MALGEGWPSPRGLLVMAVATLLSLGLLARALRVCILRANALCASPCSLRELCPSWRSTSAAEKKEREEEGWVNEEVRQVVYEHLQVRKVAHYGLFCQAISFALLPITLYLSVAPALGQSVATRRQVPPGGHMAIAFLASHFFVSVPVYFPWVINTKTVDLCYLLQMGVYSALASPVFTPEEGLLIVPMLLNFKVFGLNCVRRSQGQGGFSLLLLTNAVYVGCSSWSLQSFESSVVPKGGLVLCQAMTVFVAIIFVWHLDQTLVSLTTQSVQYQETKELLAAASALLRSCCDCCVELSEEGVITTPAADLASVLLRGCQNLQGKPFADLISDEVDRANFFKRMGEQNENGVATSMHVRTRDGNHSMLHLELLWFQFRTFDSQVRYLVGIREFNDSVADGCQRQWGPAHTSSGNTPSSVASSHSGNPAVVVIDGREVGFPIARPLVVKEPEKNVNNASSSQTEMRDLSVGVTAGFCSRVTRTSLGTPLVSLINRPKRDAFEQWVQESINALMHGEDPKDQEVLLQIPNMQLGTLWSYCRVMPGEKDDEPGAATGAEQPKDGCRESACSSGGPAVDLSHVHLLFYSLRQSRHSRGGYSPKRRVSM